MICFTVFYQGRIGTIKVMMMVVVLMVLLGRRGDVMKDMRYNLGVIRL